ncbi:MAG: copper-binding protein [Hyphomicrobiales bacterium]|nr:copper-binding protein [Hyphomicrobiales bacterium]
MFSRNIVAIAAACAALAVAGAAGATPAGLRFSESRSIMASDQSTPWRRVEVVEVNLSKRRVTIRHDALSDRPMQRMAMSFAAAEWSHIAMLRPGDHIEVQIGPGRRGRIIGFRMMHGSGNFFT